jgi:hypothetical protein
VADLLALLKKLHQEDFKKLKRKLKMKAKILKLIKKNIELLDNVELDNPEIDWFAINDDDADDNEDAFEDEAYAGGYYDAAMELAGEIIDDEDLDYDEYHLDLTEAIYDIIKYGKPFSVKSTPKMESNGKNIKIMEAKQIDYTNLANNLIDFMVTSFGLVETCEILLDLGYTDDQIYSLGFEEETIESAKIKNDKDYLGNMFGDVLGDLEKLSLRKK